MRKWFFFSVLCFILPFSGYAQSKPPRLILQIVVDQLRGDLIHRYQSKFGQEGFNYLLAHGINYQNTHHPQANTVTCVGHATIATGAYPSLHGIVANRWYDKQTKQMHTCMEDPESKIIPHIISTSRSQKNLPGASPRNLVASTLSDELVFAQKGRAFAVAFKDRSAIAMAGHAGKAFWFDKHNGGFITSQYYYQAYPAWVQDWNQHFKPKPETWQLNQPLHTYHFVNAPAFESKDPIFGKDFPHHTGSPEEPHYYRRFSMTPLVDEITAHFATTLLQQEKLGLKPKATDYLAISFAAVDVIGHRFGPNSIESEDNLLRLDKTLASLFKAVDKQVGLENTLIILTADHGINDALNYLAQYQIPTAPALNIDHLRQVIKETLSTRFQLPPETLEFIALPYVYLDHKLIMNHQVSRTKVSKALVEILRLEPGIFEAYALPLAKVELDWVSSKVDKMPFRNRTGDLYLVPPPYQTFIAKGGKHLTHGSPWQYDSFVPLIFSNKDFKPQNIIRPTNTTDIAVTLSALLQIKPPSASVGVPLVEVISSPK